MRREIEGFRVYRSENRDKGFVEMTDDLVAQTSFIDNDAGADRTYYYFVTSEEHSGLESDTSSNVIEVAAGPPLGKKQPPAQGWDSTPPAAPTQLNCALLDSGMIRLSWPPSTSPDLRYYNLYYSGEGQPKIGQSSRIASPGRSGTSYIDWGMDGNAKRHFYAITSVDRQGNESPPTFAQCE